MREYVCLRLPTIFCHKECRSKFMASNYFWLDLFTNNINYPIGESQIFAQFSCMHAISLFNKCRQTSHKQANSFYKLAPVVITAITLIILYAAANWACSQITRVSWANIYSSLSFSPFLTFSLLFVRVWRFFFPKKKITPWNKNEIRESVWNGMKQTCQLIICSM